MKKRKRKKKKEKKRKERKKERKKHVPAQLLQLTSRLLVLPRRRPRRFALRRLKVGHLVLYLDVVGAQLGRVDLETLLYVINPGVETVKLFLVRLRRVYRGVRRKW